MVVLSNRVDPRTPLAQNLESTLLAKKISRMRFFTKIVPVQKVDLRNRTEQRNDPTSPQYREPLAPKQDLERFGLSSDDRE
jgi:hypothetical protein